MICAPPRSSGNVLFLILVAVALFAALSYAVTHSTRSGGGDIAKEKATLAAGVSDDCNATVNAAVTRMTVAGNCTSQQISYQLPDGSNSNPLAPVNKSCNVFHTAGGGVAPCGVYALGSHPCMLELAIGESCNGVVYAGIFAGSRLYTTPANQGSSCWGDCSTAWFSANASSSSNGKTNTDNMAAAGIAPAIACRGLGSKWYMPAFDEMNVLYANKAAIGGFTTEWYWTSTEIPTDGARILSFADGGTTKVQKNNALNYRCVRRD